jgi:hypothetical protein
MSRAHWASFMSALSAEFALGRLAPVALISYTVYDETPLKCATRFGRKLGDESVANRVPHSDMAAELLKIENMELVIAVVVKAGDQLIMFHTEFACPSQGADRTSGEVVKHQLNESKALLNYRSFESQYPLSLSFSTRDRAGGNLRAERGCMFRDPGVLYFGQWCIIHCLHCAFGHSLGVLGPITSGCIAVGLALKPAGSLQHFKGWLVTDLTPPVLLCRFKP